MDKKAILSKIERLEALFYDTSATSAICRALSRVCLASDAYALASERLNSCEDSGAPDKSYLAKLEDEYVRRKYDFYSEFFAFLNKLK